MNRNSDVGNNQGQLWLQNEPTLKTDNRTQSNDIHVEKLTLKGNRIWKPVDLTCLQTDYNKTLGTSETSSANMK